MGARGMALSGEPTGSPGGLGGCLLAAGVRGGPGGWAGAVRGGEGGNREAERVVRRGLGGETGGGAPAGGVGEELIDDC